MKKRLFMQALAVLPLFDLTSFSVAQAMARAVPKTVDELYRAMCEAMPIGDPTIIKYAVTGEEYRETAFQISLCSLGFSANSFILDPIESEAALCRLAWKDFLAKWETVSGDGILYWRIKPELIYYEDDFLVDDETQLPVKTRIYLRYLISSKPARYTQEQLLETRPS